MLFAKHMAVWRNDCSWMIWWKLSRKADDEDVEVITYPFQSEKD